MEANRNTEYPVSTFKVDFGCSNGCRNDIRKMLQKLPGVKSMSIDAKEGKVTVVGNVNPTTLIKCFEEIGRKAKLCSFEKEPKKSHQSHGKHKQHSHSRNWCESSDFEDEFETNHSGGDHHMHRTRHGHGRRYDHNERDPREYDFGYEHSAPPPPPMTGYHHPPPPPPPMTGQQYYQQPLQGYHHPPSMPFNQPMAYPYGYGYERPPPPMYPTRPMYGYYGLGQPMRPSYGYYGSRLPRPNPMVNYADYYCHRW